MVLILTDCFFGSCTQLGSVQLCPTRRIGSGLWSNPGWNPTPVEIPVSNFFLCSFKPTRILAICLEIFLAREGTGLEPRPEGPANKSEAGDTKKSSGGASERWDAAERRWRKRETRCSWASAATATSSPPLANSTAPASFSPVGPSHFS